MVSLSQTLCLTDIAAALIKNRFSTFHINRSNAKGGVAVVVIRYSSLQNRGENTRNGLKLINFLKCVIDYQRMFQFVQRLI